MHPPADQAPPEIPAKITIAEVRYSLPELLQEIRAERATSIFGMERLDQTEIGKLFKSKAPRGKQKN